MKPPKEHPEWSEEGRDARFGPGWWILPLFAVVLVVALLLIF